MFGDAHSPLHQTHHKMFIDEDRDENYLGDYAKLQNDVSAFVAIQRGCNKRCSYCIVPYLRGPEKYRDMDDVLTEVKRAADKGITEVMLLGQTVNAYKTPNADFTTLLTKVSEIGGIKRIRFTSPHPRHYTNELIDVLLNNPKVCHYAHIPLQSGSDAMLKKMRRQHNMIIGVRMAEKVKIAVGSAVSELDNPPEDYRTLGRDLLTGLPKEISVNYKEIAHALDKSIARIEQAILDTLSNTPPELAADIYKNGIYLAGGGALLRGLDQRVSSKTKLQVHIADDPLRAVARGTGIALKNFNKFSFLIR